MMTRLGIYNFDEPVGHLSGGQRKRLALVAVLLTPCDVLLWMSRRTIWMPKWQSGWKII